jgi:hypothetical protein
MRCGRFRPLSTVLNAIRSGRLGSESKITRRPLLQQNKRTPRSLDTTQAHARSRGAGRALAHREQESAKTISDPRLRQPVQERARCAAAMAARFEDARKNPRPR